MTRKEEIRQEAISYLENIQGKEFNSVSESQCFQVYAFEEGAKWADEHPFKEIKGKMMHDICGWLDWHAKDYIGATYGPTPQYESYHLICDLKEYMEELENGKA